MRKLGLIHQEIMVHTVKHPLYFRIRALADFKLQTGIAELYKNLAGEPWLGGSVGWSIIPLTKKLLVRFPVRAHT